MAVGVLVGTAFVLSANAWPVAWLGLEMNLMCFVPVVMNDENLKKTCMVYYVTQSVGSLLVVTAGLLGDVNSWLQVILMVGVMMKMGAMPFHFWVPMVLTKLKKLGVYVMQTWQKVAPIGLMMYLCVEKEVISLLNVWMGAVTMSSMSSPILVIVFSGMVQMGWIFSVTGKLMWWFMAMYFVVLAPVVKYMSSECSNFGLSLVNAGGLPPFTGFVMKLAVVKSVTPKMGAAMLMGSGVALVAYARMLMNLSWGKAKLSVWLFFSMMMGMV